tara:strand:+ start:5832 stop:6770 length:939 start_codon:yes stop_codon:yes gene_type:complete
MEDINQGTSANTNPNTEAAFATPEASEPVASPSQENLTVEDAFFGNTENTTTDTPPSQEQAPSVEAIPPAQIDNSPKNDEKRFEYWQSQAAQKENELQALKDQVGAVPPVEAAPVSAEPSQAEEFPPPPVKPGKPQGFSREEAWSDPSSASAQYLDEVESWQDTMGEYNGLKHQYELAVMQDKFETIEAEKKQASDVQEAQRQQARQAQEIGEYVTGHHGMSNEEAADFMRTMAQPDSVSMDNLVALYRLQKGGVPAEPVAQPSPAFRQQTLAQQIPSPMGVMPASGGNSGVSDADQLMDSMITGYKKDNPW